jgi:hypothetical protein
LELRTLVVTQKTAITKTKVKTGIRKQDPDAQNLLDAKDVEEL